MVSIKWHAENLEIKPFHLNFVVLNCDNSMQQVTFKFQPIYVRHEKSSYICNITNFVFLLKNLDPWRFIKLNYICHLSQYVCNNKVRKKIKDFYEKVKELLNTESN